MAQRELKKLEQRPALSGNAQRLSGAPGSAERTMTSGRSARGPFRGRRVWEKRPRPEVAVKRIRPISLSRNAARMLITHDSGGCRFHTPGGGTNSQFNWF